MVASRPSWLADLSRQFKRHRGGCPGWFIEVHRDRLRLRADELPPRPGHPFGQRQAVTLSTPPGPSTAAAALAEACELFDAVRAGHWHWPDPHAPTHDDPSRLTPAVLSRLVGRLQASIVGERIGPSTWERTYSPYLRRLVEIAAEQDWPGDNELLEALLRRWEPNSRARQMAHDRCRALWKLAGWPWPPLLAEVRGNGKAAADPDGVRAFTDPELAELRQRIQRSSILTPADLVAWDALVVFGLRPAELQGLGLRRAGDCLVAKVSRMKRSSKGSSGPREVPAVPPQGWPADCHGLLRRWKEHGLPQGMVHRSSPGQALTQQLRRLRQQEAISCSISDELTAYSTRHSFALRLGIDLGLSVREAAELMGHSPQVHLTTYGRRLDTPKLQARVRQLVREKLNGRKP